MTSPADPSNAAIIMTIACLIVFILWVIAAGLVLVFLNRHLEKIEADHPEANRETPNWALLIYALCIFFWPAGFGFGFVFFQKPETARMGRNCIACGLADISLIVVATTTVMTVLAWFLPNSLPL